MTLRYTRFILLTVLFIGACGPDKSVHVYMIGDSTMANKPLEDNPERGWGQLFPEYFDEMVIISNHAVNGRSTKSFIDEGRWQVVLDSLQAGDFVFIQFGHNDEKEHDSTRYAAPFGAYKENLARFVTEARSVHAQPLVLTPVVRRRFDMNGHFYDTHGDYPLAVKDVAAELDVPLIDVHALSRDLIETLGEEESKKLFLWIEPGVYSSLPDGKQDDTHFSELGARRIAGLVATALADLDTPLSHHILE